MKINSRLIFILMIAIGVVLTGILSHGMNMFYNFLILPLIGLTAYLVFKRVWSIMAIGVFGVTLVWQFVVMGMDGMFKQNMYLEAFTGALTIGVIYLSLVLLGGSVGYLFTYAFHRSEEANKRKRIMKFVSGLMGIGLILGLTSITNAFTGNPLSASLATKSANNYVGEKYANLGLTVDKASYNFKFDHYVVSVKSKQSVDTYFAIYVDSFGNVIEDDYEENVLSGWNTFRRVNEGLETYGESLLRKNTTYDYDMIIISLNDKDSNQIKLLKKDKTYELSELPLNTLATVYLFSDDLTWENVAKVTLEIDRVLTEAKLDVDEYTVVLEPKAKNTETGAKGDSLGIYDFPKEKLEGKALDREMELFFNEWNKKSK